LRSRATFAVGLVLAVCAVAASTAAAFGIDTDNPPPPGVVGTPYSYTFKPKAGAPPYAFWLDGGELPPGLKIESDGLTHGTPTTPGKYIFAVGASQCCGPDSQWGFSITIRDRIAITTESLPVGVPGSPYSASITVIGSGGLGLGWTVVAGSLPPGLTLAADGTPSNGLISGIPTAVGTWTFTVRVGDTDGFTPSRAQTKQYTIAVGSPLAVQTPAVAAPAGVVGQPYNGPAPAATGGIPPYTWSLTAGTLPPGLAVVPSTGALTGTPTSAGKFAYTVSARDTGGTVASVNLSVTVANALDLVTQKVRAAKVGRRYHAKLVARGGIAPRTWSVTGGHLPRGLRLDRRSGVVSGVPRVAGSFRFRATVTDSLGQRSSERVSITVRS
jgi:hypothetical protein